MLRSSAACEQMFANQGLRTLCCAVREISSDEFIDWKQRHHAARLDIFIIKPSHYGTSHPGQLSLAIPMWIGTVSTSESWDINRHTARCIRFISFIS